MSRFIFDTPEGVVVLTADTQDDAFKQVVADMPMLLHMDNRAAVETEKLFSATPEEACLLIQPLIRLEDREVSLAKKYKAGGQLKLAREHVAVARKCLDLCERLEKEAN